MITSPLDGMSPMLSFHLMINAGLILILLAFVVGILLHAFGSSIRQTMYKLVAALYMYLIISTISTGIMGFYGTKVECGSFCANLEEFYQYRWFLLLAGLAMIMVGRTILSRLHTITLVKQNS